MASASHSLPSISSQPPSSGVVASKKPVDIFHLSICLHKTRSYNALTVTVCAVPSPSNTPRAAPAQHPPSSSPAPSHPPSPRPPATRTTHSCALTRRQRRLALQRARRARRRARRGRRRRAQRGLWWKPTPCASSRARPSSPPLPSSSPPSSCALQTHKHPPVSSQAQADRTLPDGYHTHVQACGARGFGAALSAHGAAAPPPRG